MDLALKSQGVFQYEKLLDTPFDDFNLMVKRTNEYNKQMNQQ